MIQQLPERFDMTL